MRFIICGNSVLPKNLLSWLWSDCNILAKKLVQMRPDLLIYTLWLLSICISPAPSPNTLLFHTGMSFINSNSRIIACPNVTTQIDIYLGQSIIVIIKYNFQSMYLARFALTLASSLWHGPMQWCRDRFEICQQMMNLPWNSTSFCNWLHNNKTDDPKCVSPWSIILFLNWLDHGLAHLYQFAGIIYSEILEFSGLEIVFHPGYCSLIKLIHAYIEKVGKTLVSRHVWICIIVVVLTHRNSFV